MKQRFSSLDVKVIAHELQETLVSLRLANIYDLSSKILLLKFAKPDIKKQLVIDTGFRCHLTEFARTTASAPSPFVARLRKFLKTRRLTAVSQVGTDRILEFQFSDGQYRLFLEFFASGNIILTDPELKILALARNVTEGEAQEPQRVGLQYSLDKRQNVHGIPPLTKERVKNALQAAVDKANSVQPGSKAFKSKPGGDLRKSLALSITELPPVLVDHSLQERGFDTSSKPADILADDHLLDELLASLEAAREVSKAVTATSQCTGYIFAKRRSTLGDSQTPPDESEPNRASLLYEDFHPFVPIKLKKDPAIHVLEIAGYNKTVDDFFSSLEGQKLESRLTEREAAAQRKLDAAKQDQEKRIEGLQEAQELNFRKAAAIEANVERVQEAIDAVNGLISQAMDWVDIGKLIAREKSRHNPVAEIIKLPLKLADNMITLLLDEENFDEDELDDEQEEEDPYATDEDKEQSEDQDDKNNSTEISSEASKALSVEILLTESPWSNARAYYEQRRTAAVKEEKTQAQAARALKNTTEKINQDLRKGLKQEKALLQPVRKQLWFEKFLWFISSDGYLVIGGKDAQQNEMIYKRYLRKGDAYCHADLHGASTIIIKNNPSTPGAPIPPSTLTQAGNLSVCTSGAWDSKAGMGAWWVNADQVSKSAPSGEFLPIGSFMVKGKKNFLPPAQLLLGLGILFRISEESKAKHVKHRLHYDQPSSSSQEQDDAGDREQIVDEEDEKTDGEDEASNASAEEEDDGEVEQPRDNPLQGRGQLEGMDQDDAEESDTGVIADTEHLALSDVDEPSERNARDDHHVTDNQVSEDEEAGTSSKHDQDFAETETTNTEDAARSSQNKSDHAVPPKAQPAKRGQRGKAKKKAQKYKDQDEEDRLAAEALIGAKAGQQRAEEEAKAKADRQAELAAAKERRKAQHLKQQKATAEHEEIRKVMMDEGLDVLDDDEAEKMTPLDSLVGTPLPGDEILEIVPVCAPWNALGKCKYRVKMQPGAMKKGKAVKEILERWKGAAAKKGVVDESASDKEKMWPREVELIKALRPEEIINVVPVGKVRVMVAGGAGGGSGGGNAKKGGGGGGRGGGKAGRGGKGGKGKK